MQEKRCPYYKEINHMESENWEKEEDKKGENYLSRI
jgi:hypothetical protein